MALYDPGQAPPRTAVRPALRVLNAAERDPHTPAKVLGITPAQVLAWVRLARHLRALPADYAAFGMANYSWVRAEDGTDGIALTCAYPLNAPAPNECGTVACAVGHGPGAGLAAQPREDWGRYGQRVFGLLGGCRLYYAIVCGGWAHVDDTPRGAAARICYCLAQPGHKAKLSSLSPRTELYAQYLD